MYTYLLFVLMMVLDSVKAQSEVLSEGSHIRMSVVNPGSYEFRQIPDPREERVSASVHGVRSIKHVESLFEEFPHFPSTPVVSDVSGFNIEERSSSPFDPSPFTGRLPGWTGNKKSPKKKPRRPTAGQMITKLNHLYGRTNAEDYPKIFRFTKNRVNLEDFERQKKAAIDLTPYTKGDDLDPQNIPREKLMILHGGVYDRTKPLTKAQTDALATLIDSTYSH